ncbi:MAG: DUF6421 family protein, partial [Pyrinomonadaceae bacterium]
DYFHHLGPRPLDSNLRVKMNFFAGLLEEVKVDCQSAIAAYDTGVPFGREVFEFVLFERMLRYPSQPDALTNFDAGTGMLLFEYLLQSGQGIRETKAGVSIDFDDCVTAMFKLVEEIEEIETNPDDSEYRCSAKRVVRTLLPEGAEGTRFAKPNGFARLTNLGNVDEMLLTFADLPY